MKLPRPFRSTPVRFLAAFMLLFAACGSGGPASPGVPDGPRADAAPPADAPVVADGPRPDALPADAPSGPDGPLEPPTGVMTVEPGCTRSGCIRELVRKDDYDLDLIRGFAAPGTLIDNGIRTYFVRYMSDGDEITGTVGVPDGTPPQGGWPVAVVNQFTTGIALSCAPSAGIFAPVVVAPTATHGILTLAPDAPSYGPPPSGVYLASKPAARAALDGVRAAFALAQGIGQPVARRALVVGLSQGGHSTMAAAAEQPLYAPRLEVRGFVSVAPASGMRASLTASVRAGTGFSAYGAMRLYSWQRYYMLSGGQLFRGSFVTDGPMWLESECVFDPQNGATGPLYTRFPADPAMVLSDTFLGYARDDAWPADWARIYTESEPLPRAGGAPILLVQGSADTTVSQATTDSYVASLRSRGTNLEYRVVPGATHTGTALGALTIPQAAERATLDWIQQHLGP